MVEIEYFIALVRSRAASAFRFNKNSYEELKSVYKDFEIVDAEKLRDWENNQPRC